MAEMKATARLLTTRGFGVLHTADGAKRLEERLVQAGFEGTEEQRMAWRELLFGLDDLGQYCSAVVLDEEALLETTSGGRKLVSVLQDQGIVVGARVDGGLFPLNGFGETGTDGVVALPDKCQDHYQLGARLALWRTTIQCNMELPTDVAVWENMSCLADGARICQVNGLTPLLEVEVVADRGNHSIERTQYVCEKVYNQAVRLMTERDVNLEAVLLMTGACTPGLEVGPSLPDDIAAATVRAFWRTLPPAVGGVLLLPGNAAPDEAARNTRAVQEAASKAPWPVVPVYKSGLLEPVMSTWVGSGGDMAPARELFLRLLRANREVQLAPYESLL